MNHKNLFADCLLLFIFGAFIGMLIYKSPVISHWDITPLFIGSKMKLAEIFSNFYYYPADVYLFRPLAFLLFGSLYNLVGLNNMVYYVIKAITLGTFSVLAYLIFIKLAKFERKKAFISSLLAVVSPSVLDSIWKVPEIEVVGVVFLYFSFLIFINLRKYKKFNRYAVLFSSLFIMSLIISILFKETMRVFGVILLTSYFLFFQKKFTRIQKIMYIFAIAMCILISLFYRPQPTSLTQKMPLTIQYLWFPVNLNTTMLMYSVFITGSLILFISSIIYLKKTRFVPVIGFLLFIFLLSIPVISPFIYMGMTLFSFETVSIMFFFSILLVFGLSVKIFKGNRAVKFYAASTFFVLISLIGYLLIFPNSRQFLSIRSFVVVVPFLIYIIIDSMTSVWKFLKTINKLDKFLLGSLFIFALVAIPYYFFFTTFNLSQEHVAFSNIDFKTKEYLSNLNLTNSVIFYTNEIFHFDDSDIKIFRDTNTSNTKILFLNSHRLPNGPDFKDEICMKVQDNLKDKNIFIYSTRYRTTLDDKASKIIEGNFEWLERYDTFRYLKPLPSSSQYFLWPWDSGIATSYEKSNNNKDTQLEEFLINNSKLIFNSSYSYIQTPKWIEDIFQRIINHIPLIGDYQYEGKIYYLNESDLNCSGWYPKQKIDNIEFRWMSQNATMLIYNPSSTEEIATLNIKAWSYNKSRTLQIFLNNKKLTTHFFSVPESMDEFVIKPFILNPGENLIVFNSKEGCDEPAKGEYFGDKRCLSISFTNLTVIKEEDILDKGFVFGENWHETAKTGDIEFRWMSQNATIFLYNSDNVSEEIQLQFVADSFYIPRTLELYLNDKQVQIYNIANGSFITTPKLILEPLVNVIKFQSKERCDVPSELNVFNYTKCISFVVSNLKILKKPLEISYGENWHLINQDNKTYKAMSQDAVLSFLYEKNWYNEETKENTTFRWMSQNATLTIFRKGSTTEKLKFITDIFNESRTLSIFVNDKLLETHFIKNGTLIQTIYFKLSSGINTIRFQSKERCDIPNELNKNNPDKRCLSLLFSDIELENVESANKTITPMYIDNWYDVEELENYHWYWMSQNASVFSFNPFEDRDVILNITLQSFYKPRTLDIYLNDRYRSSYTIPPDKKISLTMSLNSNFGNNIIKFVSREGCQKPSEIIGTHDTRCLSFAFFEIKIFPEGWE